jgi:hypothetical protein
VFALVYGTFKIFWLMMKFLLVAVVAMDGVLWWMCLATVWIFSPNKRAMSRTVNRFGWSFSRTMRSLR